MSSKKEKSFTAKVAEFFKKKKMDIKFKNAGEGHRLSDDTRQPISVVKSQYAPAARTDFSDSALRAGEAALNRNTDRPREVRPRPKVSNTAMNAKNEMDFEKEEMRKAYELRDRAFGEKVEVEKPQQLNEVLYCCPALFEYDVIGGYQEVESDIYKYLLSEANENALLASCLIVHSRCKNSELLSSCLKIIETLLNNIIKNPDDIKYRKVRLANEKIKENILQVDGAIDFLKAIGFSVVSQLKPDSDQEMEECLIMHDEACIPEKLTEYLENIKQAEPIKPVLYRNTQIFHKSNLVNLTEEDLPHDFFRISLEELKRQNYLRKQQLEESGMLLTKTMRENMKLRDKRRYRYVLIRVVFPNNWVLQGTFHAHNSLGDVNAWISDCLKVDDSYFLSMPPIIRKITNYDQTIVDAELAPCSTLRLTFDKISLNECPDKDANYFLKDKLLS